MRKLIVVSVAVLLAAGFTVSASVFDVSEAQEATSDPPSTSADPYFQVVDNAMKERFSARGWEEREADDQAYGESYATAESYADAARFRVKVPEDDYYSVYARWSATAENTTAARFGIPTTSGARWDAVDQSVDGGFWVRIGAYKMEKGERVLQVTGNPEQEGRVVADAVMVIRDVLVGRDGRTASYANPDELAPDYAGSGEPMYSTMAVNQNNPTRSDIVEVARRHLRTPYGHRTCGNDVMEDCSCLTRLVYRVFGRKLPDSPVYQWRMKAGTKVFNKANLRSGDLVFHDLNRDGRLDDHYRDHVSIWAGNGNIIHASTYFDEVVISEEKYLRGFRGGKTFRGFRSPNA